MEFNELVNRALEIRYAYDQLNKQKGQKEWELAECVQGFVGDVGALVKLSMIKNNYRGGEGDIDAKLRHEISDCLWSIITIADKLNIDLEKEFMHTMDELDVRIKQGRN